MHYKFAVFYTDSIYETIINKFNESHDDVKVYFSDCKLNDLDTTLFDYLIVTTTRNFLNFYKLPTEASTQTLKDGYLFTSKDARAYIQGGINPSQVDMRPYKIINSTLQEMEMTELLEKGDYCYYVDDTIHAPAIYEMLYRNIYNNFKTTLVTHYYDLKGLADANDETRPRSFYLDKGRITLSVRAPMVIFCSETNFKTIRSLRNDVCPINQTFYVIKNITETDLFQTTHDIITQSRSKLDRIVCKRVNPSYCVVTCSKVVSIRYAHIYDPFKTHWFAWIDFGCGHVCRNVQESVEKIIENPKPRAAFTYIHYRSHSEIEIIESYLKYMNPCGVAGGFFTIERDLIMEFFSACMSIYYEMLRFGVNQGDEAVFTYCYDRHPHFFTLNYGDYYSLFTNYLYVTEDYPCIKNYFLQQSIVKERADLAATCALQILDSVGRSNLKLPESELDWLKTLI